MSHAAILRQRARRYLTLSVMSGCVIMFASIFAHSLWLPMADVNSAFRNVHIHTLLHSYWSAQELPLLGLHETSIAGGPAIRNIVIGVLEFAVLPLILLRRPRAALVCGVFALCLIVLVRSIERRHGTNFTPAESITASHIETLTADAIDPNPRSSSSDGDTDHRALQPLLHFVLAQKAYSEGDPWRTKASLDQIDSKRIPNAWVTSWRIAVMREWSSANGAPAAPRTYEPDIGRISLRTQRVVSRCCFLLTISAAIIGLSLAGLSGVLLQRAQRLQKLAQQ